MTHKQNADFLSPPVLLEGSAQDLFLESTLRDLQLYQFQVESNCLGMTVARIFEKYPWVPGVILLEQGQFMGMLSRRRLLEFLIRPQGLELFLEHPLEVLYSYARTKMLILPEHTTILIAAQWALRRSPELRGEPIVVKIEPHSYHLLDWHELNIAYWQIRGIETQVRYERTQVQMIQTEKMASLGRLVDGVAHEILDPVGFIWGNLTYVSSYCEDLMRLLAAYDKCGIPVPTAVHQLKDEIELEFLQQDLPQTIASIRAGAERLTKLATSLQNFCHIDDVHPKPADLHASLDSIILLLKSRLSGEIEVIKSYGNLPPIPCYIGQLNQVFMNILTNAIDALINKAVGQKLAKDFQGDSQVNNAYQPRIEITTKVDSPDVPEILSVTHPEVQNERWVYIRVADNGVGMSPKKQQRILESFSTEKRAEKETSLSVSYQIVTAKHGGKFKMQSQLGVGTEFEIMLPLN